ncbi:MAG: DUF3052 family protein [Acidobacteria bacterium]|nr:DUF3052 family protein [Acidobacteriota bacterium]
MGQEAECLAHAGGKSGAGKAHLEGTGLSFRGELSFDIPIGEVKSVDAKKGQLIVVTAAGETRLDLGPKAEKWALKIRYPKGRLDKLGIKPGSRVSVLGVEDEDFWAELDQRDAEASRELSEGRDFIFLRVDDEAELERLAGLERYLDRDGSIWVLWPKGQSHIKRDHVFAASKAADLVDVKICAFSDELSGLKVMIPKARR